MHEISVAQSILKTIEGSTDLSQVVSIEQIKVSIGILSGVEPEALKTAFSLIPKSDHFRKTTLNIRTQPIVIFCDACDAESTLEDSYVLKCPACKKRVQIIRKGEELEIETIRCTYA